MCRARIAIAAALLCLAVVPPAMLASLPSVCLFQIFLHRACLGCGMTRALSCLLHGQWQTGLEYNRGAAVLLPVLLLFLLTGAVPIGQKAAAIRRA